MMKNFLRLLAVVTGVACAQPPVSERVDFNWQVRPILSDNCFRCHGPDANSRQAGLRLDRKEAAYAQAITPGKPEESELIRRIASKDPAYHMPPPGASAKSLTEAEIATLTQWVKEGAEYKPHFDYFDPVEPGTPSILKRGGQRVATIVMYLAEPEKGGGTTFPDVSLVVAPKRGNAVFFSYDRPHPVTRTLHGGAPVLAGEKWIATKWLREGRFE